MQQRLIIQRKTFITWLLRVWRVANAVAFLLAIVGPWFSSDDAYSDGLNGIGVLIATPVLVVITVIFDRSFAGWLVVLSMILIGYSAVFYTAVSMLGLFSLGVFGRDQRRVNTQSYRLLSIGLLSAVVLIASTYYAASITGDVSPIPLRYYRWGLWLTCATLLSSAWLEVLNIVVNAPTKEVV